MNLRTLRKKLAQQSLFCYDNTKYGVERPVRIGGIDGYPMQKVPA